MKLIFVYRCRLVKLDIELHFHLEAFFTAEENAEIKTYRNRRGRN